MFILTAIITIAGLLFINISSPVAARDEFNVPKPLASGQVMGVMAINSRQESIAPLNPEAVRPALPAYPSQPPVPVLKTAHQSPPAVSASSAVVFDVNSRKVLYDKNPDEISAIASITKLMTALVALEQKPDFSSVYTVARGDRREGGRIFLFLGDRVTIDDLFHAILVGSGNSETIALVHALGMTEADFVAKMNAKAASLGLRKTTFADPVGLDERNTSTAYELIEIVRAAMAQERIRQAVTQASYTFTTEQGSRRVIESTDTLLTEDSDYHVIGGKTGYIGSAGFCFVGKFTDQNGTRPLVSVVLGSHSVTSRFSETDALVRWAYENYEWAPTNY